jgi:predicted dehydrogenase
MINTVVVGAGKWALECWAPLLNAHRDRYRVQAIVDPVPAHTHRLAAALSLDPARCHASIDAALVATPGLTAAIVLSAPEHHAENIVELANAGLHVLTEKPLATNPDDADRILTAVADNEVKAAVIQNYRYQQRIQLTRTLSQNGHLGPLHYLVVRFAADYRQPGSWDVGDAHHMDAPLLVEASIHHLDMVRYLTGRDIQAVTALTTNPPGSSFAGDCIGAALLDLGDGVFALYEATLLAAGSENRWRNEYYRLEHRDGSLTCDGPTVTVTRDGVSKRQTATDQDMFTGHRHLVHAFADWLDGGPAPETTVTDNVRSLTGVFAALTSTGAGAARIDVPTAVLTPPPA